jgi:hypothetical protein
MTKDGRARVKLAKKPDDWISLDPGWREKQMGTRKVEKQIVGLSRLTMTTGGEGNVVWMCIGRLSSLGVQLL